MKRKTKKPVDKTQTIGDLKKKKWDINRVLGIGLKFGKEEAKYRDMVMKNGKNVPVTKEMAMAITKGDKAYIGTRIFPNRAERRIKKERFQSNKKGISLIVLSASKYRKEVQVESGKRIEHYVKC